MRSWWVSTPWRSGAGWRSNAGALACDAPDAEGLDRIERVLRGVAGGAGADHILLAAGGSSNGPVEAAARLARDRARVVDIGKLRLDLPWNAYYDKELDVRFSRSYGPGRYDDRYELEGIDYPVGYVRWTERRNLACFVDLVARGSLTIGSLVSGTFPVEDAVSVYDRLSSGSLPGVGFLFEYPHGTDGAPTTPHPSDDRGASVVSAPRTPAPAPHPDSRAPRCDWASWARATMRRRSLLPHLAADEDIELRHVATTRSLTAVNAQRRFGFTTMSTDAEAVFADETVDAVFVVTRHHSHADLTCRALAAGKAVFVEKPLALSSDELARVVEVVRETGNDRLTVGFNRRFAPLLVDLRQRFGPPGGGAMLRYSVNAGELGGRSWYADEKLEGSRFTGEGGHFIDTVSWWLDARPTEVSAMAGRDPSDLQVTIRFDDASIATISYVTVGNARYPKEIFDAASGGAAPAWTISGRRRCGAGDAGPCAGPAGRSTRARATRSAPS